MFLSRVDFPIFSILKVSYLAQALLGRFEVYFNNVLLAIYRSSIFAESSMGLRR